MHQRGRSDATMSRCVLAVLKENVIPVPQFVENFLPTVIKYLDHEDEAIVSMWSSTLIEAIPLLPADVLESHIAPVALQRSQPIKPVNLRIISCTIIGELALQYDPTSLKRDLLPVCLSLCQDENPQVRASICYQLEKIIKQLKGEAFKTTLGPSLVELGADESIKVKEAAFVTAVSILEVVDEDDVQTTLIPFLKRIIQYGFTTDDNILLPVAKLFGEMCRGIQHVTSERPEFIKYFIAIAGVGLPPLRRRGTTMLDSDYEIKFPSMASEQSTLCRQAAAENLPAVFSYCDGDMEIIDELLPLLDTLCSDPSLLVRKTVGIGISSIREMVPNRSVFLRKNLIKLLNDDAEEVLEGMVPQLSTLIKGLSVNEFYNPKLEVTFTAELSLALLKCEGLVSVSRNWRLYCDYLNQIKILADSLPQETLYNDYMCLFMKRMHKTRTVPVRQALIETTLHFLRRLYSLEIRTRTIETIINDFCRSPNFYNRIFFLRSCNSFFRIFSLAYFRKHFFAPTVSLIDDAIPNIRWTLMKLLPKLEYVAAHPEDEALKRQLDEIRHKLRNDKDNEISRTMSNEEEIQLTEEDATLFVDDKEKFDEETKMGEYKSGFSTKTLPGSKIPRSPSSNSGLGSINKPVMRRKPRQQDSEGSNEVQKSESKERNNNYSPENVNKVQTKTSKRGIPVSRPAKSHSAPSSRQGSFKDKRLSLDEIDLNKNMLVVPEGDFINSSPQKPSQLPRPLSCINFSTRQSSFSKKSNSSKLPVSRISAIRLSK